jgi:hypothetical protein
MEFPRRYFVINEHIITMKNCRTAKVVSRLQQFRQFFQRSTATLEILSTEDDDGPP